MLGRVSKVPTFMISRRLSSANAEFGGIASVTVSLSYFYDYWSKVRLPRGGRVALMRASDAAVIAQYPPPPDGLSFAPIDKAAFDEALRTTAQAGLYSYIAEGRERTGAYRQVGGVPLYMNVSMPVDAYWTPWYVQTRLYGAFALIALLALLALTALASEQFHEQAANAALLERQVSVRTNELRTETAALEILNRTGSALAAELDLDRIIENVVDAGIELTGAQFGAFFCGLSQDGKEHYATFGTSGFSEAFAALDVREIAAPAFKDGETVRLDNIAVEQGHDGTPFTAEAAPEAPVIRSLMAVPILLRTGEIHGILVFGHERPQMFSQRTERLLGGPDGPGRHRAREQPPLSQRPERDRGAQAGPDAAIAADPRTASPGQEHARHRPGGGGRHRPLGPEHRRLLPCLRRAHHLARQHAFAADGGRVADRIPARDHGEGTASL